MIVYVSVQRFSTAGRRIRATLPASFRKRFRYLSYEELLFERAGPVAHYIFTDFDRLTRYEMECVAAFCSALRAVAPDAKILNDPVRALDRTPLLAALHRAGINDFDVVRLDTGERPAAYPVFIRSEDGYGGPETDIINTADELEAAIADFSRRGLPLKGRIAVGYAAEPGPDGLYRKYAAFNIFGDVFAYHLQQSRNWVVKRRRTVFGGALKAAGEIVSSPEAAAEELEYVKTNPHADELKRVFDIAGIDFGRVDYGIVGGRIQVYEINTNPNATTNRIAAAAARADINLPRRLAAFEKIDTPIARRGRVAFRESRPRVHSFRWPTWRMPVSLLRRLADILSGTAARK